MSGDRTASEIDCNGPILIHFDRPCGRIGDVVKALSTKCFNDPAGVAQLAEHGICNPRVEGSSPSAGSICFLSFFHESLESQGF